MDIKDIELSKKALKDLQKVPKPILNKFQVWVEIVQEQGLRSAQKIKGFHDEPLKGVRKGQRSIRLNRAYRAIYTIRHKAVELIYVEEVNKHEY